MVIAVCSQKGGTGKTTTAAALASGAFFRGKSSLAIDLDAQSNLTYIMGAEPGKGSFDVMTGADPSEVIQHTKQGDVLAGSPALATADSTLHGESRVYALSNALNTLYIQYRVIVVDTPPTLNTLQINALAAVDMFIIPLQPSISCLQGLYTLANLYKDVQAYNTALKPAGILFTMCGRTNIARSLETQIGETAKALAFPVLNTRIRKGVAVEEAQLLRESIFCYDVKSKPAEDYLSLLDELGI